MCLAKEHAAERLHEWGHVVATAMAFGEVLVRTGEFEWVWAEEPENVGLALRPTGRDIATWPVNMICHRPRARQQTTAQEMLEGVRNTLADLA